MGLAAGRRRAEGLDLVALDVVPVRLDTQPRSLVYRHVSLSVDTCQLVCELWMIYRRFGLSDFRLYQGELVVIDIADGSDTVPVGHALTVELNVQAEALGSMGHIHSTGDAAVLIYPRSYEIRSPVDDEIQRSWNRYRQPAAGIVSGT